MPGARVRGRPAGQRAAWARQDTGPRRATVRACTGPASLGLAPAVCGSCTHPVSRPARRARDRSPPQQRRARSRVSANHWGPSSSVEPILLRRDEGDLVLAVKWNHAADRARRRRSGLRGSRASRAAEGAKRLQGGSRFAHGRGAREPPSLRRPGRITESFLDHAASSRDRTPLPALMPQLPRGSAPPGARRVSRSAA
jgi:hypothetical protein